MNCGVFRLGFAALALVAAAPALAADIYLPGADQGFKWTGGVGVLSLRGERFVFSQPGSSDVMSHLIFESTAPMLTGELSVALPEGWTFSASADAALGGDSYMEDYDWLDYDGDLLVDYTTDNWTHRSQHNATDLDHYFSGSLLIGRDVALREGFKLNVNGGFKYTDVQWTTRGGSFVYSTAGYRDDIFELPDDLKGITYRQMFPSFIAGVDGEVSQGNWTFGASAHAGFTFMGVGDDHHWQRDINFVDKPGYAPIVSAGATVEYALENGLDLFIGGSAEKIFAGRGGIDCALISDGSPCGNPEGHVDDMGADSLFTAKFTMGAKGTF